MLRKHIFFDGYLPAAKRVVRLERLGKSLDQLRKFRILHPEVHPRTQAHDSSAGIGWLPSRQLRALPASPFLVPAVLETLLASRYSRVTEVVACEADEKCSDPLLSTPTDYILTGDSDLLIHHPPGRIVMFNDLISCEQMKKKRVLTFSCYDPNAIARRFELSNLLLVAYFIKQDPYLSFINCVEMAKRPVKEEESQFAEFCREYKFDPVVALAEDVDEHINGDTVKVLAKLDPRVSEFVQNWTQRTLRFGYVRVTIIN